MLTLTAEQRAVVEHAGDVHLLVRAVPGSGKTTTLAYRVAALVGRGVAPGAIQVLMFNRAVRDTLRARLDALGVPGAVQVHTFDAFALRLLKRAEERGLTRRLWVDEGEGGPRRRIHEAHRQVRDQVDDAEDVERAVSFWKAHLVVPARARFPSNPALVEAYRIHEELRQAEDGVRLGLGDLAYTAVGVLRRGGAVDPPPAHLLVDEFQDTNPARVELLQRVAGPETRLLVVGDEDQGINEWCGSHPRYFREFERIFPSRPTERLPLSVSFRLGGRLAQAANAVIVHNRERSAATVVPAGAAPGVVEACGELGAGLRRLLDAGVQPSQLAVLYRSRAEGVRALSALARAGLPVQTEDAGLLQRGPGPDLVRVVARAAIRDELERPEHFWLLARAGVDYVKGEPFKQGLLRHVGGVRAYLADRGWHRRSGQLDRVVDGLGRLGRALDHIARAPDVAEAIKRIDEAFDADNVLKSKGRSERAQAQAVSSYEALADWLSTQTFRLEELEARVDALDLKQGRAPAECVWASTVHKAKGLEWPYVLVAGVFDGGFPADEFGSVPGNEEHPDGLPQSPFLEQERRTFYVAITRASERVVLERPPATPSLFHRELLGGVRSQRGPATPTDVARTIRRPKGDAPAHGGLAWTIEQDSELLSTWEAGSGLAALAATFGRSEGSIVSRLVRVGAVQTRDEARRRR